MYVKSLLSWLCAFFLFFLLVRLSGGYFSNLSIFCFCFVLIALGLFWKKEFSPQRFFLVGGIVWGALYIFPPAEEDFSHVIVFKKNPTSFGQNLVVEVFKTEGGSSTSGYYLTKGQDSAGALGALKSSSFKAYSQQESSDFLSNIRFKLFALIEKLPFKWRPFLRTIVLGDREGLPFRMGELFKNLGLFHLLVVSGLHVTLLCMFVLFVLTFIPKALYSLTLLSPRVWFSLEPILRVLSLFLIIFYSCIIAFPPSTQRAVLLYMVCQGALIGGFSLDCKDRILLGLFLQSLFFPLDFFTMSSFLSWLSYSIVLSTSGKSLGALLRTQGLLSLLSISIFGQLSLIGFVLNLYLVPLFPCVLASSFFLLGKGYLPDWLVSISESVLDIFLRGLENISLFMEDYPFLLLSIEGHLVRIIVFLGLLCLLLRTVPWKSRHS